MIFILIFIKAAFNQPLLSANNYLFIMYMYVSICLSVRNTHVMSVESIRGIWIP